jgi:hypothetical protein
VTGSAGTYTTSLAFDKNGAPSISYGDGLHWGNLMFAQKNGTNWDTGIVAKGTGGDAGEYSSLAFDREGIPHIAYNDGQNYATLYYATLNQTSREWEFAMIDDNGVGGNTGFDSSLIIDAAGIPHVSYRDGNHYANLMYAVWDGVNWTSMKVDDGGGLTGNTGYSSSLVLDTTGNPHIAYYDAGNWALRYASWNGTGWYTETIDNRGNVGQYASLALDNQNRPHIGYYALSQHELRYATRATAADQWVIRTIDNDGVSGQYVKIALDSTGHPGFVYYETMNHALKFAGWTDG